MNRPQERVSLFGCGGDRLVGILHVPVEREPEIGVLVVVGGPQYRVGSHRQFVLMARGFAAAGYPVLRFDHRGIGDSDGGPRSFEALDEDVRAALDTLHAEFPGLRGSVIFGLCDAASAALMYCRNDTRLAGLILANPWVHSEAGAAKAYVKHYYGRRLLQAAFWRKVFSGGFDAAGSLRDLLTKLRATARGSQVSRGSFRERMLEGLSAFRGPVLLQISGRDLTAAEFMDLCQSDDRWRSALDRHNVVVRRYESADHTFAAAGAFGAAAADCMAWLDALPGR
jgi:exosortase A-associated hydrolase 1